MASINQITIGLDNGLSLTMCQIIICTNAELLSFVTVKWNYSEISIKMQIFKCSQRCEIFIEAQCVHLIVMMTLSNGNIFRVTGHLCGEIPGPRWIPRTNGNLRRYRAHYDVIVMKWSSLVSCLSGHIGIGGNSSPIETSYFIYKIWVNFPSCTMYPMEYE